MPSFPLLDVAIGMIFVYLLASLICSSINEGFESLLRNRANNLEAGIRTLLSDNKNTTWRQSIGAWWNSFLPWVNSIEDPSITRRFYTHPLIRGLYMKEERLPSYIPARNFALAVMDLVGKDLGQNLLHGAAPSATALAASVTVPEVATVAGGPTAPKDSAPAGLKSTIQMLVDAAGNDAGQARLNIENWFNSSMDRVSGWYKSRTQWILFIIGLFVAVLGNIDSISLFQTLSHDKDLQTVVGSAAEAFAKQGPPAGQGSKTGYDSAVQQLNALQLPIGWLNGADTTGKVDSGRIPPVWRKPKDCASTAIACQSPFGWSYYLFSLHWFGWFLTAAATSLGAPFWFDTLNKFIVVRSTVKPQEKSPEEPSKDRSSTAT